MASLAAFQQFTLRGVRITENELGRGSYAVVLELEYRGLKCAGKKLYRLLYEAGIGHAAHRYLEECSLLSQTRHPNIVQFLGVCFEEGSQFPILVMEFLPTNLTSCLERYGILSNEISYSILHDVSLGLAYLHGRTPAIVHRDLSANNVLLSTNMTAKISDLGVARILNLTPLQASRMTETPGTPAYMPPEVMVADPHYNTSIDVFSFGVMMIHTFTAKWPLPKIGPTRIDPTDPDRLIPVTEVERREEFLRNIPSENLLIDLITRCLSNNPERRPGAMELVHRMSGVVLEHPPSFENKLEMIQRISSLLIEKKELEDEIARNELKVEEKVEEIEALYEEKRRQQEESEDNVERMKLAQSVETYQLKLQIEGLRQQLEFQQTQLDMDQTLLNSRDDAILELTAQCRELSEEVKHQTATISNSQAESAARLRTITKLESNVYYLTTQTAIKDSIIISKDDFLEKKKAMIQGLNTQLTKAKDYLASKPQPLQVQLSHSKCSDAPIKMSNGKAVAIGGKVYYGGGFCDHPDDVNEFIVHCYCPSQDKWSSLPQLSVRYFGLGEINNQLVVVGGADPSSTWSNHVLTFAKGKIWKQTIPPMPTARIVPAIVSLPEYLVVAGVARALYTSVVEIFNVNILQWMKSDTIPYDCKNPTMVIFNDAFFILGGLQTSVKHLKSALTVSIDKLLSNSVAIGTVQSPNHESAWKEIANTPSYCPIPINLSDTLFAIGGSENEYTYTSCKRIYAYSSSMDSWLYVSDLPSPRALSAAVRLSSTECIMIGGRDENWDRLAAVNKIKVTTSIV